MQKQVQNEMSLAPNILTVFIDKMQTYTLYYAAPDFVLPDVVTRLSLNDQRRLYHRPQLAQQQQWQVSRSVKAIAPCEWGVLSHSQNHVAWLVSDSGSLKMGVDLQHITPRNMATWHDWILSDDENVWLVPHSDLAKYYALWTLKESLIKASQGEWADLRQVGLMRCGDVWRLHTHGQMGWSGSVWRLGAFALAAVWRGQAQVQFCGLGKWANMTPQLYFHFQAA